MSFGSQQTSYGPQSPNIRTNGDVRVFYNSGEIPIIIDPNEMEKLINIFYGEIVELERIIEEYYESEVKRTAIRNKNKINGMSEKYYKSAIKKQTVYFNQIDKFINNPSNKKIKGRYDYIAADLDEQLIAFKHRFDSFDETFKYLMNKFVQTVEDKYSIEIEEKMLVKIFIAYMYYYCDVGENDD
ncbi:hypothetical protein P4K71_09085 [Bacillus cereus]|uniref:ABC-three component system protein n=1 Tax=Bacillus TaxID=1386 RepID=UPI000A39ADFE|nr:MULTISPECIES: ABC-three component system protein [Bacillus]MEB8736528.1 hypothetical protein [Bacillus cereus]MDM5036144.1 hypothetical protein [Bacillus sp. OR-18]MEB8905355.1 hypothetical protein [Bacillus cereus]MEB9922970.1 hypothetical protein [Bacillus cereus]MEB9986142.1 hypothetical protein [Bacillus cereus]